MSNTNSTGPLKSTNGILSLNKSTGQWTKKIGPRPIRFGAVTRDPKGDNAEALYFAERDAWERGENPRQQQTHSALKLPMLLWEIADRWCIMRRGLLAITDESKRITSISYNGGFKAMELLLKLKGEKTNPLAWSQDEWKKLRSDLGDGISPYTKDQRISYVRSMFAWAQRMGHIPNMPAWGDEFDGVSKAEKEKHRYLFQQENGERKFPVNRAVAIIDATESACIRPNIQPVQLVRARLLRACTYLAANTGAYSKDIACLTFDTFDTKAGYIETLRAKTSVLWQACLWGRTMQAVREYLDVRPAPAKPEWSALVFITAEGAPVNYRWDVTDKKGNVRPARNDFLARMTGNLLDSLGIESAGLNFGAWRHTFRSMVSGENADAIKRVMAHQFDGSEGAYTKLEESQLRPVTNRAERTLWPEDFASRGQGQGLRLVG